MKRIFAAALLLLSFASVAFAEGVGTAPPTSQGSTGKPPVAMPLG
jgi:hypothetical protein